MMCRRPATLLLLLVLLLLAPSAATAQVLTPRIIGGGAATLAQYPWQAYITAPASGGGNTLCGGVVLSATRIATAGHCVQGQSAFSVYAGRTSRSAGPGPFQVSGAAVMPSYDSPRGANDAAVLTLATPLPLQTGVIEPIALVDPGTAIPAGTPLEVSGYGWTTSNGPASDTLQAVTVNAVSDGECGVDYTTVTPPFDAVSELCAAAPGKDSCSGDSGGPLIRRTSPPVLVGLVSQGYGCAQAGYPGIYTEVADPAINAFLAGRSSPQNLSAPVLAGTAQVGQALSCTPGSWSGSPSYSYAFLGSGGVLQGPGQDASFLVPAGTENTLIRCQVTATNPDGTTGIAESAALGPVAAAPAAPPTAASSAAAPVAPVLVDRTAPKAKVLSGRCVAKRCSLQVKVTDAGYSTGVRGLTVTVTSTYASTCTSKGRRRPCTRSVRRTLHASAAKGGTWAVVASGVPYGRQRFSIAAVDEAGNRQVKATIATLTAKKPSKTSKPK
jgi:trypsin